MVGNGVRFTTRFLTGIGGGWYGDFWGATKVGTIPHQIKGFPLGEGGVPMWGINEKGFYHTISLQVLHRIFIGDNLVGHGTLEIIPLGGDIGG